MKRWRSRLRWGWFAGNLVVVGVAHTWLQHALAENDVVAVLLSAGPHTPPALIVQAMAFVVVRVLAVVYLPYMVCNELGIVAWDWWQRQKQAGDKLATTSRQAELPPTLDGAGEG